MTRYLATYIRVRCHELEHEIKQQSHLLYWANVWFFAFVFSDNFSYSLAYSFSAKIILKHLSYKSSKYLDDQV